MISFDGSIYLKEAVKKACRDYQSIADIRMTENNGLICCSIQNPRADPERIRDEFGNYVLNLTVMMGGSEN